MNKFFKEINYFIILNVLYYIFLQEPFTTISPIWDIVLIETTGVMIDIADSMVFEPSKIHHAHNWLLMDNDGLSTRKNKIVASKIS